MYKRQCRNGSKPPLRATALKARLFARRRPRRASAEAVSYTHLDVYKRQVYNYVHIGNARPVVVFDTLRRYLAYQGNRCLLYTSRCV